eukprot:1160008-Pelagomonas_calceolata.AAC.9
MKNIVCLHFCSPSLHPLKLPQHRRVWKEHGHATTTELMELWPLDARAMQQQHGHATTMELMELWPLDARAIEQARTQGQGHSASYCMLGGCGQHKHKEIPHLHKDGLESTRHSPSNSPASDHPL